MVLEPKRPKISLFYLSDESRAAQAESNEPKRVYGELATAPAAGLRSRGFARTIRLLMRQGDALTL